jgi:hypothetical protein
LNPSLCEGRRKTLCRITPRFPLRLRTLGAKRSAPSNREATSGQLLREALSHT